MGAAFPPDVWRQLKGLPAGELCQAPERDAWQRDTRGGSQYIYRKVVNNSVLRVSVHVHPKKTFGSALLKALLADIAWSIADLRRLKLIK